MRPAPICVARRMRCASPPESVAAAREKGQVRVEGKDYIMQDGDVVNFRFNV